MIPMSETAFYILLSLIQPLHGYGIIKHVTTITQGRIVLGAGTVYGTLKKLQKAHLIRLVAEDDGRKIYQATPLGEKQLQTERKRLRELLRNAEVLDDDNHEKI